MILPPAIEASSPIRQLEQLPELATPSETGEFLGIATATLARWRVDGTGPRVTRLGRHVRYRKADLLDFITGVD